MKNIGYADTKNRQGNSPFFKRRGEVIVPGDSDEQSNVQSIAPTETTSTSIKKTNLDNSGTAKTDRVVIKSDFGESNKSKNRQVANAGVEAATYVPVVGSVIHGGRAIQDAKKGDWGSAAMNTALTIPFAKYAKGGGKLAKTIQKYKNKSKLLSGADRTYAKGLLGKNITNRHELLKAWKKESTRYRSVDINDKMLSNPDFLKKASKYVDVKDKNALRKYLAVSAREQKIGNDVMEGVLGKGGDKRILYTTPNKQLAATYAGNTPGTKSYMAKIRDLTDVSNLSDQKLIGKIKSYKHKKIPFNKFDINKAQHGTGFQMGATRNASKDRIMGVNNVISKQTDPFVVFGNKPLIDPNKVKLSFYKNN
jgi:hypothetical protein